MVLSALASLLAPPRCTACGAATDRRQIVCSRCDSALEYARPGNGMLATPRGALEVRWACEYGGVARDLVRALKFGARTSAARPIAACMRPLIDGPGAVVPVPPAPRRHRQRGFDPAEAIARALAFEAGLALSSCLTRADGGRQVGRSRAERLADPPRVRLVAPPPDAAVLIDDVFTTGATLAAAADALGTATTACVFARATGSGA
jgi:predicted amidophosphoribosyltransferase